MPIVPTINYLHQLAEAARWADSIQRIYAIHIESIGPYGYVTIHRDFSDCYTVRYVSFDEIPWC